MSTLNFQNLQQPTGRIIDQGNAAYLFFGGTAYLGLLQNVDYLELYKYGIDKYGLNNGTSRSNNVQLAIYEDVEEDLASRFGFNHAAVFSSGYLATQAAVRSLCVNKMVFYAPDCHPALWIEQNPQVTGDFLDWANDVIQKINSADHDEFVIIANCMDNLSPALFDFTQFNQIDSSKHVLLILDDSHGLGILHKNQCSFDVKKLNKQLKVVVVASLAKGLGTDAGVVFGDFDEVQVVKNHPIFNGSSPGAPAAMYALKHGKAIYSFAFDQMQRNTALLADIVAPLNLNSIPNFPVFTCQIPALYQQLLNHNIVISSFPYPLPNSPLLNRIVVSALHRPADVEWLGELLSRENILKL